MIESQHVRRYHDEMSLRKRKKTVKISSSVKNWNGKSVKSKSIVAGESVYILSSTIHLPLSLSKKTFYGSMMHALDSPVFMSLVFLVWLSYVTDRHLYQKLGNDLSVTLDQVGVTHVSEGWVRFTRATLELDFGVWLAPMVQLWDVALLARIWKKFKNTL